LKPKTQISKSIFQRFYRLHNETSCAACIVGPPQYDLQAFPFRIYGWLSVTALSGLWPWPLIFWPWNWCGMSHVAQTTYLPILVLLRLFLVELSANTRQTDDVTL